jgi:hypothetical protein
MGDYRDDLKRHHPDETVIRVGSRDWTSASLLRGAALLPIAATGWQPACLGAVLVGVRGPLTLLSA